jgi:lysophospholipase L1-like esterase
VFLLLWFYSFIAPFQRDITEQYYSSLDWEKKDINDIPSTRNFYAVRKVRGSHKHYEVRINSQGFRDREYSVTKSADCLRIAIVGDSVTFGVGVDIENTFVKQAERLLRSRCKKKIEVMNFGASGASTINELELIERKVLLYKPDLIILEMDPNDGEVIKQIKKVDPFLDSLIIRCKNSKLELSQWLKSKLEFYKYYRYRKAFAPGDEYNNIVIPFQEIVGLCKRSGILFAVASYDPAYQRDFYGLVLDTIGRQGIPLLDISRTRFHALSYREKYVNADLDANGQPIDCHPNEYGSKIIAEEIVRFLTQSYPSILSCADFDLL